MDVYEQSEERRETAEQLSSIVRHSRDKRGHHGPIPAYATTFLWQVSDVATNELERSFLLEEQLIISRLLLIDNANFVI